MDKNVSLPKATEVNGNLFNSFNSLCLTRLKPDMLVFYFWKDIFGLQW